jgi:hypothetical protein
MISHDLLYILYVKMIVETVGYAIRTSDSLDEFKKLDSKSEYKLLLMFWADKASAQTAIKIRLVDVYGFLFSTHTSAVFTAVNYVGGESSLDLVMAISDSLSAPLQVHR